MKFLSNFLLHDGLVGFENYVPANMMHRARVLTCRVVTRSCRCPSFGCWAKEGLAVECVGGHPLAGALSMQPAGTLCRDQPRGRGSGIHPPQNVGKLPCSSCGARGAFLTLELEKLTYE